MASASNKMLAHLWHFLRQPVPHIGRVYARDIKVAENVKAISRRL